MHCDRRLETQTSAHERDAADAWLDALSNAVEKASDQAIELHDRYLRLGRRYETLAKEMDFTLLYNPQRRLFSVGLNLEDGRLDRAHYDMLASEARIASLVAIAKGDAEHRHWFQLGRALTESLPGRVGPALLGRHDVRILDAPLVFAERARLAPGAKLRRGRRSSNRVRPAARRSLGHLGIGIRGPGRQRRLSLPVVRRAGTWV